MSLPWFRMYTEFATDPVMQSLAFEDQRHYVILLCMKGSGVLDREYPSPEVRNRVIYRGLGLDPASASEAHRRLAELGLVEDNWNPSAWDKRQFKSDDSSKRVSNWRKKKKKGVTEVKRYSNGAVTPQDTDTDTDTDKKKDMSSKLDHVFRHWQERMNHPKAVLTRSRQDLIRRRIKDGYTADDLVKAIDGCAATPFNMGENSDGRIYDSIELILRDAKHIEDFMRNYDKPPKGNSNGTGSKQSPLDRVREATGSTESFDLSEGDEGMGRVN